MDRWKGDNLEKVSKVAVSRSSLLECERRSLLKEAPSELILDDHDDAARIELAIKKFQNILHLNPNTFTKKQEAIFSLALKEALYEIMDVPHSHRDLEKEMLRIKRHDFWK